jgi:regulatory protein
LKQRPELTLKSRALGYLARREYSLSELRRKLKPHTEDDQELNLLLDDLAARGWLSDQRFAEQLIHARAKKYGSQRIIHELREKGVPETIISDAVASIRGDELAAAQAVWRKKFPELPRDAAERAKQMRFLLGRGFLMDIIRSVLQGAEDD